MCVTPASPNEIMVASVAGLTPCLRSKYSRRTRIRTRERSGRAWGPSSCVSVWAERHRDICDLLRSLNRVVFRRNSPLATLTSDRLNMPIRLMGPLLRLQVNSWTCIAHKFKQPENLGQCCSQSVAQSIKRRISASREGLAASPFFSPWHGSCRAASCP